MLRLRAELFQAAVRQLSGGEAVTFGTDDPTYIDWLAKRQLPEELKQFLVENALSCETTFDGTGGMWAPRDVMVLNDQEEALSSSALLGVGNAINGDFIVIDFATGQGRSGFVAHELLADKGPSEDVGDAFMPVARSIGEMLHGMVAVEDFPYDYWDAVDRPILYDAETVATPRERCLGTAMEQIESFVESVRGRLVDRFDIEEELRAEGRESVGRWNEAGPLKLEWFTFSEEADRWINDMKTVVFEFRRNNLSGGMMSLGFARDLLRLKPDEFEYFDISDRVFVRMSWCGAGDEVQC